MCVGIIRKNSLVGGRTRAESNPGHWARHALLHMAAECVSHSATRAGLTLLSNVNIILQHRIHSYKSAVPLTYPHDTVPHAHHAACSCWWSVWYTVDWWLSPVYHTDRPPKLTAPETMTWQLYLQPFHRYGWCPPKFKWFMWPNHAPSRNGLPSATFNLPTKFEVSISTHYEDAKGNTKCRK